MTAVKKKKTTATPTAGKKQTASQKIDALNKKLIDHEKNFLVLADEIDQLKTVISGLSRRLNAAIEASENGDAITNKAVADIIVSQNIQELENKVSFLVEQGVLEKASKDGTTGPKTFVVGKEVGADGEVVNPRVQFALDSLSTDLLEKLSGLKIGDKIALREGDPELEIMEIYNLLDPSIEQNFEEEETEEATTTES